MATVADLRQNSVDIDPNWYAGQPETTEDALLGTADAAQITSVPTVLTKLQKWGDYDSWGEPVWPSRFIPMKTPLSQEILDNWQLSNPPKHRLTVGDILAAQAAHGRHVGLILDLSNHDCLYSSDVPATVDYLHVQLVAKELPPLEFVQEVGRAANTYWRQHKDSYIAIHCAYGFNRTGFVVCSYLIENCGLSVDQALQSFARARPPGVKHEKFKMELHARYGLLNVHIQRPISCCGPVCAVCGQASSSSGSGTAFSSNGFGKQPATSANTAAGSKHSSSISVMDGYAITDVERSCGLKSQRPTTAEIKQQAESLNQQPSPSVALRSSVSKPKPPIPASFSPLAATASNSIDGSVPPRMTDGTSSPLPLISGRCYSSGSIGDNSSIGCSPDNTADFMLTGGSSTHSSSSQGCVAGRSPLSRQRQQQQQQQQLQQQSLTAQWLSRKAVNQQSNCSQQLSSAAGCIQEPVVPLLAEPAAGACTAAGVLGSSRRDAADTAADLDTDAGVFEMDPYGDDQEEQGSSRQTSRPNILGSSDGWRVVIPGEQLRQQRAASAEQLSDMLAAVQLQQPEQQADGQYNTSSSNSSTNRQQQCQTATADDVAAVSASGCDCSCHTAGPGFLPLSPASAGGYSTDGGVLQHQLRYSSMLGHLNDESCTSSGRLVENESFGRITSADLLYNLR